MDIPRVVATIRQALPPEAKDVALHEPRFAGSEWSYVKECLDTGWVSSAGTFVERFEKMLAEFTGARRAIAVTNGTAALHICLRSVGVQPGDEVIVPTLTFVATANAVAYCGAKPHFADSEIATLGLDPRKLEDYLRDIAEVKEGTCCNRLTGSRIAAVMPMHTFGHPVDLDPLSEVCRQFSIPLVEDAAESLGSYYKGKHTGNVGRLAALSFNGNKIVTTGGGGAVLTNDEELAQQVKHATTTARLRHQWAFVHDQVGYNYRMPNINAALGCAQMEQLPDFLRSKRALSERYQQLFADVPNVRFVTEPANSRSNYWLNCILLDREYAHQRDALVQATNESGLMTRPAWTLMHHLPMFRDCPKMDLSVAEDIEARLVSIPSSAVLGRQM
ncbi:MAG: LegC family aminotransferase [Acidobacteriota bacterium]|nr:LegC family aminotransferase [Acidobacteriota bacterium]